MNPKRDLTVNGVTKPLLDWSAESGVPPATIRSRLALGWTPEQAVSTASQKKFAGGGRHPAAAPRPCPKLKRHKATGRAYCEWQTAGKREVRYFGAWASKDATDAYARFALEWATKTAAPSSPIAPGERLSLAGLVKRHLEHCRAWYVKGGKVTSEYHLRKSACGYALRVGARLSADQFTPTHLRQARDLMVADGKQRKTCNAYQRRIAQAFGWGVGRQLVPADVHAALKLVETLPAGKGLAAESAGRRRPVAWEVVEATLPHLHRREDRRAVLEVLVRCHWLIGCRPHELCELRAGDLDRSRDPWVWTVSRHKTEHRGGGGDGGAKERRYFVGPRAQALFAPLIEGRKESERVFVLPSRRVKAGTPVTRIEYGRFVARACAAAQVTPWTPHQLRHARATEIVRVYESNAAAAAAIGDSPEVTREVYVDPDDAVRRRIARELG